MAAAQGFSSSSIAGFGREDVRASLFFRIPLGAPSARTPAPRLGFELSRGCAQSSLALSSDDRGCGLGPVTGVSLSRALDGRYLDLSFTGLRELPLARMNLATGRLSAAEEGTGRDNSTLVALAVLGGVALGAGIATLADERDQGLNCPEGEVPDVVRGFCQLIRF
jgi:hypothetical protein